MVSFEQCARETDRTQDSTLLLHRIFEAQAEANPTTVAVVFGQESITYGELDARANRIARYLRRRGVSCGDVVALPIRRSIDAYASILGVLKAGAAYLPIDPDYPASRIAWMLENSGAAILTTAELEAHQHEIAAESPMPLISGDGELDPGDLCYVIYTSGSSGRPKGVMVEHRNAASLVHAEAGIFHVRGFDRVYQGASLCFDLSIEEIWLAFRAGATLIAATPEMAQSGPDLARHLSACGVTILSCVPTVLSMVEGDIPTLRLLILGGERCPPHLVARWARPGRRIVNTYGPTETTVIATYADVSAGKPVTIGRAVPGCDVYILDSDLRPMPPGETGEICIGGAGVARGYLGLPEETRDRFITIAQSTRIYRSGDLGRMDRHGRIEFVGRADGQVKLRGLRIELGEIESALLRARGVAAAACAVRENVIAAYVVPRNCDSVNEERLRSELRGWLPEWMMPTHIETLADLPRLPNGKLDRDSLPVPHTKNRRARRFDASTETERHMLGVWRSLVKARPQTNEISPDDDFFLDLGGHSLLAAQMVSELRRDARFASLALRDLYSHPTIARLAAIVDSRTTAPRPEDSTAAASAGHIRCAHFLAGASQALSFYFIFGFRAAQWLTPYLVYFLCHSLARALASAAALQPALILIAAACKWIMLGRVKPGRHRLWSAYYLRWWFVQTLIAGLPLKRLGGTPLLPFVYRLFGARIGKEVHIATDQLSAFDVASIGDGSSIDEGASLSGYTVAGGDLLIGAISIGRKCFVGTGSILCPNTVMEDGARLDDLSLLQSGSTIPAGQTWAGSPPQRTFREPMHTNVHPICSHPRRTAVIALYTLLSLSFPLIELLAFLPGIALLTRSWLTAPLAGASYILSLISLTACLKWLLVGRARGGTYPVHGWFYVRNWIVEQLLALSIEAAGPLHATLYVKPWYRALGVKLGRFAEVSNASVTTPDLLKIGDEATIADEVSLGASRVEGGWLTLGPTKLGRRAFVGNNAVVPAGTALADETLIGVLTVAPSDRGSFTTWLGSPPILLPHRQRHTAFSEEQTFRPSRKRQCERGLFELLRVTFPATGFVLVAVAVLEAALHVWSRLGPTVAVLALPAIFAACCALVIFVIVPLKWLMVGRYRPFQAPFWSGFVWRLEFVNALFEFLAAPMGLEVLRGTPFLAWYLRLLGARIGHRVYIDTTGFLEFDMVEVGDNAILNRDCILQTHLFEDRVLKASTVRIGSNCEVGEKSIVLYDAVMHDRARLGPLSLAMKGEELTSGKVWIGSPLAACKKEPR